MGIPEEEFERAMPDLAKNAFDDPSWRSNPRMPLVSELVELFWRAYGAAAGEPPGCGAGRSEGMVVRMTTNAMWIHVDPERTAGVPDEAVRG